jgi:cytochrome o ubiquinol oxidase operon protein cyoD
MSDNHGKIAGHGSLKSYVIGFILSIILTLIPYHLVVNHVLTIEGTYIAILAFAVLQFLVQVFFFLHVTEGKSGKANVLALIFTIVVLVILVIGSMWIMYNLDYNMMEH